MNASSPIPQKMKSTPRQPHPLARKLTRRGFLRAGVRGGIAVGTLGVSSVAYGAGVEIDWVEVVSLEVAMPRLPRAFDGFRIAQISDIHIEGGGMRHHFPAIARLTSAQNADAIVLTGDYTTFPDIWQEEPLVQGFKELRAPSGVFAVLGNHDQWGPPAGFPQGAPGGAALARAALSRAGARELCNDCFAIERSGERLWICGLDDWSMGHSDFAALQNRLPAQSCAVLLVHEPDFADAAAESGRFDLMLAGHSHGGQIALPFFGPIHLPGGARQYPRGRYQVGAMTHYTNRGIGVVDLPIRFCARPEITVFTLKCV